MKVVEKFISINGESTRAGELAIFVRFKGCNLACSYCDTMWANKADCAYDEETPEEICDFILESGINNVTLTGGEPLLQPEISKLISLLAETGQIRVEIETNGSVALAPFADAKAKAVFTMDYKLPSSGCSSKMNTDNFLLLGKEDTVKFVAGSSEDLEHALEIIREHRLCGRCNIYFSPVFGEIKPEEIVNFMITNKLNDVRMQIQMHKVIWDPDARGV